VYVRFLRFLFMNHAFLVYMCGIPLNAKSISAPTRVRRPFSIRWAPFIRDSPGLGQHGVPWDQVSRSSLEHCKATFKNATAPGSGSRNKGNQASRAKTAGHRKRPKFSIISQKRRVSIEFELFVGRVYQHKIERSHPSPKFVGLTKNFYHPKGQPSPSPPLTPSPRPSLALTGWSRLSRSCPRR
jgi:hypothetical protein